MTSHLRFVLDANVFIEAHRRYYAFDIAPSFWRIILELAKKGLIVSIDRVKGELMNSDQDDVLSNWANSEFDPWFISTDDEVVIDAYAEIINWSFNQEQFYPFAKDEFARVADSWLVAFAKAYNYKVVTLEQYNREMRNRINIPSVCRAFGVEYLNTFEMLRTLNVQLGE